MNPKITSRKNFLKKRSSPLTIGFTAIADFTSFIGQEYLSGIMEAAKNYGIHFINMTSALRPSLFVDSSFFRQYLSKLQFVQKPLLDGAITWASSLSGYMKDDEIKNLFAGLSPLPLVDIGYLDIPNVPSIRIDNDYSIHLLIEHLVKSHGFTKIAFFGSKFSLPHLLRLESFKKTMKSFNLDVRDDWIFLSESLDEQNVAAQVKRFLTTFGMTNRFGKSDNSGMSGNALAMAGSDWRAGEKPQAILTSSDIIARILIDELEKNEIRVPEDIAVTGFNNQFASLTASCPMTTIDLAYFKRGYEAVELLIDKIMGDEANSPENLIFNVPTSLVIRESCGCFEDAILDAADDESFESEISFQSASEIEIRNYLEKSLTENLPFVAENRKNALISAILSDLYYTNYPPPLPHRAKSTILTWFRREMSFRRNYAISLRNNLGSSLTKEISALRKIILPLASQNQETVRRLENIFHSLRSLLAVRDRYKMISEQGKSYEGANLMNLALALSSCENISQIESILRYKLSSISISGIIICLSQALADNLSYVNLAIIQPDTQNEYAHLLPQKIREPALFPKRFFPKNTPFFLSLMTFYHSGKFLGYAYVNMNENENLALYDDLQEILSQNLYRIYLKEGKTRQNAVAFTNREKLVEKVPISPDENSLVKGGKLTSEAIVDYLLEHIDEVCDLDKMANFFDLSKSYLSRRVHELTGYSTQDLHERLKIEQAKNLIKIGNLKMNEIASQLGFSNPNYFSNVFKKVTGIRPTEFADLQKKR